MIKILLIILLLFTFFSLNNAKLSISYVTVLLPSYILPSGRQTKLTLHASDGCFLWHSTVYIASISADDDSKCIVNGKQGSTSATLAVTPIRRFNGRKSTRIVATDISSNDEIECEVFVDLISRIEIMTSTRRVNVGEKESLDVQAYDNANNVFTSLQGLEFSWTWPSNNILAEISYSEACMEATKERQEMERLGLESDRRPVEGLNPGQVNVTVNILDPAHTVSTTVEFSVTRPLDLLPSLALITPATELPLFLLEKNKRKTTGTNINPCSAASSTAEWKLISLPSDDYTWFVANDSALYVEENDGLITGIDFGDSRVTAAHKTLTNHSRDAEIMIIEPTRIELNLQYIDPNLIKVEDIDVNNLRKKAQDIVQIRKKCDNKWHISENKKYELQIRLYSEEGCMQLGNNMNFLVTINGKSVIVNHEYKQSVEIDVYCPWMKVELNAKEIGESEIQVQLVEVITSDQSSLNIKYIPKHDIIAKEYIKVTKSIEIIGYNDQQAFIPYTNSQNNHYLFIESIGGSNQYQWISQNTKLIQIDSFDNNNHQKSNKIKANALGIGQASVKVHDICDPDNYDSILIRSSEPDIPTFFKTENEVLVGDMLSLTILLTDRAGNLYDDCNSLQLDLSLEKVNHNDDHPTTIFSLNTSKEGSGWISCNVMNHNKLFHDNKLTNQMKKIGIK